MQPLTDIHRNCRDCHKPFVLTPRDVKWFVDHELYLPTRCPSCRRLQRELREQQAKSERDAEEWEWMRRAGSAELAASRF